MFKTDNITVLFAGAGAGKTTHLLKCVEEDLQTFRPEDIAFVSYTRKGAYEGKDRLVRKLNIDADRLAFFKTLHALTYAELGYTSDQIFSRKHAKAFNKLLGFHLTTSEISDSNTPDDRLFSIYEQRRSGHKDLYSELDDFDAQRYKRLVSAYENFKKKHGLYDYTDCLLQFIARGKPVPVRVAYIDEAQDLTTLQWKVCITAFSLAEKIYVAGDDYQSIYKYAGARPDVLINMAKKYKTVKLEISYRLPRKVYSFAKAVTDVLGEKEDKDYKPFKKSEGTVQFVNDRDYLSKLIYAHKDETWLVLFRNNYHAAKFEKLLQSMCMMYHTPQGFVVSERDLSKIRKYYNYRKEGYTTNVSLEQFKQAYGIEDINRDFSESSLIFKEELRELYQVYVDKHGVEFLYEEARKPPKVFVSTIHRVKGSEARNVAVFLDCSYKVYRNRWRDFDSELRLLYVAFTRAKENLYIVSSETQFGMDDIVATLQEEFEL
jgi:superfamily I DNA/RNA helicase